MMLLVLGLILFIVVIANIPAQLLDERWDRLWWFLRPRILLRCSRTFRQLVIVLVQVDHSSIVAISKARPQILLLLLLRLSCQFVSSSYCKLPVEIPPHQLTIRVLQTGHTIEWVLIGERILHA